MIYKGLQIRKGNYTYLLLLMSMCLFGSVVLTSFKAETVTANQVAGAVRQSFIQDMAALQQQSRNLIQTLEWLDREQASLQQVQEAFYDVKQGYKKVEYLVEYLDPELAKNLNGAPLPKVLIEEANYQTLTHLKPSVRTFPPEGLQVMEELLFAGPLYPAKAKEAVVLAYALQEEVALLAKSLHHQSLTDKQLLESLREELIRIMAMGITGFDAPAAGRVIEHATLALQPVLHAAQQYAKATNGKAKDHSTCNRQFCTSGSTLILRPSTGCTL